MVLVEQATHRLTVIAKTQDSADVVEREQHYRIRHLQWNDLVRQGAYQRLRTEVFVNQLGWDIPIGADQREYDRYDVGGGNDINVYCVYGVARDTEYLLGGIRIFRLRTWDDSMVMHEFRDAGMFPDHVLHELESRYEASDLIELTRLCVQPGRWYRPLASEPAVGFNLAAARDFTYAAAYLEADVTMRNVALAIVDSLYLKVMRRSHFVLDEIYSHNLDTREGYALVAVDLDATIGAIRSAGAQDRANRMTILYRSEGSTRSWHERNIK